MLELMLCSMLTLVPDFLFRRFVQGKRLGREITLFSVWYELRWGITLCLILTILLITVVFTIIRRRPMQPLCSAPSRYFPRLVVG